MCLPSEAPSKPRIRLIDVIVAIAVLLFLVALLFPAVQSAREAVWRSNCVGSLKQLGLALWNYEQAQRRFPPAYFADDQGRPTHSWRVLLFPYMERDDLYKRYNFRKPWNDAENLALAGGLPLGMNDQFPIYHCPSDRRTEKVNISYATFVGDKVYSPGPTGRTMKEITDGTSNTIWLGEFSESGIHSMEPRDLEFDAMSFKINDFGRPSIRSPHSGTANVSVLDGSVRSLDDHVESDVVRALLTVAGGEKLRYSDW